MKINIPDKEYKNAQEEIEALFEMNKFLSDCKFIAQSEKIHWVVPFAILEQITKIINKYGTT